MQKPNGRRVQADQAREHELRAWEMRLAGKGQAEIGVALGINQGSVSRILGRCRKRRLEEVAALVDREILEAQDAALDQEATLTPQSATEENAFVEGFLLGYAAGHSLRRRPSRPELLALFLTTRKARRRRQEHIVVGAEG